MYSLYVYAHVLCFLEYFLKNILFCLLLFSPIQFFVHRQILHIWRPCSCNDKIRDIKCLLVLWNILYIDLINLWFSWESSHKAASRDIKGLSWIEAVWSWSFVENRRLRNPQCRDSRHSEFRFSIYFFMQIVIKGRIGEMDNQKI